jgi:hypothetical protein|tara:strand:- start:395 stop:1003 length:609 start_codon:yes stop_codon:yes gene_type:complete
MSGWNISDDWLIYRGAAEKDLHLIDFISNKHFIIKNLELPLLERSAESQIYQEFFQIDRQALFMSNGKKVKIINVDTLLGRTTKVDVMQRQMENAEHERYHARTGTSHHEHKVDFEKVEIDYQETTVQEHHFTLDEERRIIHMGEGFKSVDVNKRGSEQKENFNVFVNIEHADDCQISFCQLQFLKDKWTKGGKEATILELN